MKKQKWIKEVWIDEIDEMSILFVITLLFFVAVALISHSTSYICYKNPEKCVYEPTQKLFEDSCAINPTRKNSCLQFDDVIKNPEEYCLFMKNNAWEKLCEPRLKTQEELDIDDCDNNPREDDKCKCEEYQNKTIIDTKSVRIIDCRTGKLIQKDSECDILCKIYNSTIIQECIKSHPYKHPED